MKRILIGLFCLMLLKSVAAQSDSTKVDIIEDCLISFLIERFNYDFDTLIFCEFFIIDGIPIENAPMYRNNHVPLCYGSEDVKSYWIGKVDSTLFHNSKDCEFLILYILSYQKKNEKRQFIRAMKKEYLVEKELNIQFRVNREIISKQNLQSNKSKIKSKQIEIFEVYENPNIIDEKGNRVDKLIEIFLFE